MEPSPKSAPSLRALLLLAVAAGVLLPGLLWLGAERLLLDAADARLRAAVLLLAALQAVATGAALMWALARRFDAPLERLTLQLERLVSGRPSAPLHWPPGD